MARIIVMEVCPHFQTEGTSPMNYYYLEDCLELLECRLCGVVINMEDYNKDMEDYGED